MPTVATFDIEYLQYLGPDGTLVRDDLPEFAKDTKQLVDLFKEMLFVRAFDTKAVALQRTGKLGTYASCLGHEATHIGIGSSMQYDDVFAPSYREYGAQFMRGVKPREVLMYWGGDERGNDFSGPPHDYSWCVPIGTQCLHAAGAALAFKLRNEPRVAVCSLGDGATSKGDFYEGINAAGAWKLPLVFVVTNNQWAISVPRHAQSASETLAQKAIAGGFEGIQVDGNDVIAVRHAMDLALAKARGGGGPTLIEALTYRLADHTTADDATRYRSPDELAEAWKLEPLSRLRAYLVASGVWDKAKEDALLKECNEQVQAAAQTYLDTPHPGVECMFDHLYATLPAALEKQRAAALGDK